jgi:6-hydroxynicotinate reductase
MTGHNRVDHSADHAEGPPSAEPEVRVLDKSRPRSENMAANKIECDACPVLCQITEGRSGACDRYANVQGVLTRMDPLLLLTSPDSVLDEGSTNDNTDTTFITGVGAGTTYPDYKPAPFIVASQVRGVDMVTVVTEGIFSYCSFKVKIDTDRYLGPERASIRHRGENVGHVTTAEYGSQMLSLGGVHHLTGGSKKEGRITCEMMLALGNKQAVELDIDGGAKLIVQAGRPPVVDGIEEKHMRVGCGSATIGIFAKQWFGHVDEVVVVDDHITGVLSEHQAGRCLDMPLSGIKIKGRKSTPGRYFQVANPGSGWGGTDIADPLDIIDSIDPDHARPGMRVLMTSTTGEHSAWFVLDEQLHLVPAPMPPAVKKVVDRIIENCEPSLASVMFLAGAGGSLRAGVTDNPVWLTHSIKQAITHVSCGGAPAYVWAGGGITVMVDVMRMPDRSFGSVPTPAIVAPIEFTLRRDDYARLGGHLDAVRSLEEVIATERARSVQQSAEQGSWPLLQKPMLG